MVAVVHRVVGDGDGDGDGNGHASSDGNVNGP